MISIKKWICLISISLIFTCVYSNSYAIEITDQKQETSIKKKIDTSHLAGINLWIAEVYNDNRFLYAIVVTLVMGVLGSLIAYGTDLLLRMMGINVTKISHRE